MKCLYCSAECITIGIDRERPDHWECDLHPMTVNYYQYTSNKDKNYTAPNFLYFLYRYKDKKYGIWLYLTAQPAFLMKDPKPSFEIVYYPAERGPDVLLHLDFLPNITPDNVAQKLPIYLTFL